MREDFLGSEQLLKKKKHQIYKIFFITVNTSRPRQNGRHFTDDSFKCISLNENVWILIKISLKFVPKGPINNIPALVQIMAWWRPGDKPLSEPMMVSLPTLSLNELIMIMAEESVVDKTRQIRTPVLRIPPAVTSQAKMKN